VSEHVEQSVALATRTRRFLATIIDMCLVPILTLFLVMIFGLVEHAEDYAAGNNMFFNILATAILGYMILNGFLLWSRGQTVGKLLLGIAIVSSDGFDHMEPASFWRLILIRAIFFPLLFLLVMPFLPAILFPDIGWLFVIPIMDQLTILGNNRRCIHDYVSRTRVIRR
tara:strand:- start:79 stop:585 length:507 start_codon:yes stop_codon:yes gene_type:complete